MMPTRADKILWPNCFWHMTSQRKPGVVLLREWRIKPVSTNAISEIHVGGFDELGENGNCCRIEPNTV